MVDLWPMQGEASLDKAIQSIEKYNVEVSLFLRQPHQMLDVINRSQAASTIPLLVAVDGEWGVDMRMIALLSGPTNLL